MRPAVGRHRRDRSVGAGRVRVRARGVGGHLLRGRLAGAVVERVLFEVVEPSPRLVFQALAGRLVTADVEDPPGVEQVLRASHSGRDLQVSWAHDTSRRVHAFTVPFWIWPVWR